MPLQPGTSLGPYAVTAKITFPVGIIVPLHRRHALIRPWVSSGIGGTLPIFEKRSALGQALLNRAKVFARPFGQLVKRAFGEPST